jgi:excisionase family DNA binding protein
MTGEATDFERSSSFGGRLRVSTVLGVRLPQLVTPEEAAEYLGVSPYTVRSRLMEGTLAGRKHGARWLIRVSDLADHVEPNNIERS